MATRYIPEDYPDLVTALIASASGDTIVLDTSAALPTHDYTCALDNITIEAADGRVPVLDHTGATTAGLTITGDNWTLTGITLRNRVAGSGGSALILNGTTGHNFVACTFEGSVRALNGEASGFTGNVYRCQFRHISVSAINTALAVNVDSCLFLRCRGSSVEIDTGNFVNCTLVGCGGSGTVAYAAVIKNCTAQDCET